MNFLENPFLADSTKLGQLAQLGDYVGGYIGTIFVIAGTVFVWLTYRNSKKKDLRDSTISVFEKILESYDQIIDGAEYHGSKKREVFGNFLSEFNTAIKAIDEIDPRMTIESKVDIAYHFVYYGTSITVDSELMNYDCELIKSIRKKITDKRSDDIYLSGYQNVLSNYFRTIYNAYEFLHSSKLSAKEKYQIGKILRTKFTNHEQAVIALNIISRLGREWVSSGLLLRYKVIKNIPRNFLTFSGGATVKTLIPYIDYEWEKSSYHILRYLKFDFRFLSFWIQIKLFPRLAK